jgi:hypothetical protein
VAALTAVYIDFTSRPSYRAWRWLSLLPERAAVDIRPYCLHLEGVDERGRSRGPWERTASTVGLELLALGEYAREAGRQCHEALVDTAFAAVHDLRRDLSQPEAWLELVAAIDLDLEQFTQDGERWRAEVGLWHREAEDEFGVTGVPSLVFDDRAALFVRLDEDVEDAGAARRLLEDLADLASQPVDEVQRKA